MALYAPAISCSATQLAERLTYSIRSTFSVGSRCRCVRGRAVGDRPVVRRRIGRRGVALRRSPRRRAGAVLRVRDPRAGSLAGFARRAIGVLVAPDERRAVRAAAGPRARGDALEDLGLVVGAARLSGAEVAPLGRRLKRDVAPDEPG